MKVLWSIGAGFVGIAASLELNQNFDGRISGSKLNKRHLEGERRGLCQVGLEKRKDRRETHSSCASTPCTLEHLPNPLAPVMLYYLPSSFTKTLMLPARHLSSLTISYKPAR